MGFGSEWLISRVLFSSHVTAKRVVIIPLGHASPRASCDTPGSFGRAVLERSPIWSCSGWGLPCSRRYRRPGELLPRRFTLTATPLFREGAADFSLLHFPRGHPHQSLTGIPPYGARTFLPPMQARTGDHPSHFDAPTLSRKPAIATPSLKNWPTRSELRRVVPCAGRISRSAFSFWAVTRPRRRRSMHPNPRRNPSPNPCSRRQSLHLRQTKFESREEW